MPHCIHANKCSHTIYTVVHSETWLPNYIRKPDPQCQTFYKHRINHSTLCLSKTTQFPNKAQDLVPTTTCQWQAPHLLFAVTTHSLPTASHKVAAISGGVRERLACKKDVMRGIQVLCVICTELTLE